MAIRGGKGGDPASFGKGGSEGSGNTGASRSTGAGESDNPYADFDYPGEWATRRPTLQNQPKVIGETDYEGNSKSGLDLHRARHSTKRWSAWNDAYTKLKSASGLTKGGSTKKKKEQSLIVAPKTPTIPTKKDVGVDVKPKMGIKEYGQQLGEIHTVLQTHLKNVSSLNLRPEAQAEADAAQSHMDNATSSLREAHSARAGVVVGGKRYSGDSKAGEHFDAALGHLRKAHDVLAGDHLTTVAHIHNINAPLPTEHLEKLEGASSFTRVGKEGAPMTSIPLGEKDTIDPRAINVKAMEKLIGKQTAVGKRIKKAQKGTRRQNKFDVLTGKEEKSLGGLPGPEVRTRRRGKTGMVDTPVNPKRRTRRNDRTGGGIKANMARFQTPKFEGAFEPESKPATGRVAPKEMQAPMGTAPAKKPKGKK